MSARLPSQYDDLEKFSGWVLGNDRLRNRKRLASSMEEIQEFYDAMMGRLDNILEYLSQFPPTEMPEDARNLCFLALSLAETAPCVENYSQPSVIDGYDSERLVRTNRDLLQLDS